MSPVGAFVAVLGLIARFALLLLALESYTLRDDVPENHIAAAVRTMTKRHTGLVVLLWGLVNLVVGLIAGHIWSAW